MLKEHWGLFPLPFYTLFSFSNWEQLAIFHVGTNECLNCKGAQSSDLLNFQLRYPPCVAQSSNGIWCNFFKTDFAKQVLSNSNCSLSLYALSNLAGLLDRKKKKCALGRQFSKILKGSAKQEVSECCNHSSWLRLTRKQVREVFCSTAPAQPQPSSSHTPRPVDVAGTEAEAECRDRQTHFSVCIADCRAWYGGWTFSNMFFSIEKMM